MPKIVSLSPPTQAPAGLTPNRATLADVEQALRSAPRLMETHGLTEEDLSMLGDRHIGAGHYAHVFSLPSGLVLKITDDADDAMAAAVIRDANAAGQYPPGLPQVVDVKRFRDKVEEDETNGWGMTRPLFAIVYEAVVPLKPSLSDEQRAAVRVVLPDMSQLGVWRLQGVTPEHFRYEEVEAAKLLLETPMVAKRLDEAMRGVRWLWDKGFEVKDLHAGNFGTAAGGRSVLFDFGHYSNAYVEDQPEIEVARNSATTASSMPNVRAAFDECFDALKEQFPDFGALELHQDEKAGGDNGHGSERQFGYCMDSKPIRVAFAAKTEDMPVANIRGLMAHEFGHALDYRYGDKLGKMLGQRLPVGVERRADAIAKAVFGRTIKYDGRDIQCVACQGKSVRPRRLGP